MHIYRVRLAPNDHPLVNSKDTGPRILLVKFEKDFIDDSYNLNCENYSSNRYKSSTRYNPIFDFQNYIQIIFLLHSFAVWSVLVCISFVYSETKP